MSELDDMMQEKEDSDIRNSCFKCVHRELSGYCKYNEKCDATIHGKYFERKKENK